MWRPPELEDASYATDFRIPAEDGKRAPRMPAFFASRERWEAKPASLLYRVVREHLGSPPPGLGRRPGDDQAPGRAPENCSEPHFLRRESLVRTPAAHPSGLRLLVRDDREVGKAGSSSSYSKVLAPSPAR
jgi:hypothetical protein